MSFSGIKEGLIWITLQELQMSTIVIVTISTINYRIQILLYTAKSFQRVWNIDF